MLKADSTVDQSKEGVIASDADIAAGTDSGASLTNDDIAGLYDLTVSLLHTKALGLAVAAVLGGANALLMSKELQTEFQHHATSIIFLVLGNGSGNCEKRVSPPSADRGG